ncbi:peptidase family m1 domain-containing protein [Phthorimaea operculella]|nr:peptidase family m1 domain-containing protein [Phthorimaea operculella]
MVAGKTPVMLSHLVLLAAACVSLTVATDPAYRLNTPIVPQSYAISLTPFFDTRDVNAFTFNGEVTITFQTTSVTNQIKLHSEDLNFTETDITLTNGNTAVPLNTASALEFVTNYTFALINLQGDLAVNTVYTLKIVYRGPIRTDLKGFYRNYYYENGVKKWLGTTQMEPVHARKVFPCFDEPHLKATFTLTIDRPEAFQPTRANTKMQTSVSLGNGYVREIFFPTPKMSTYLVAFLVSEYEAAYYATNGTRELGVYTRPDAKNQSAYAFDISQRVVDALGAYFGIDFYGVDPNLKLDHVAVVDFNSGAMENWGLVTYRESLLLYVPEESTPYYKYRVAQIVAHETTHMWFGNLVTCHWWSNTWLNEGFANYFQDYITSLIEPEVGAGDQLVIGSVYSAYDADSTPDSNPITNNNVNSPDEISGHFGTISYQKAGSVIRMMHNLLGDEGFILGLNFYLNDNKFNVGYPDLMFTALNEGAQSAKSLEQYEAYTNVDDVMEPWITQAGHPLLDVNVNYETETVYLSQKRFYSNSSYESNELYPIPITYTTGASPDFNNLKPNFIMYNKTDYFKVSNLSQNWVILNLQETGLYRVNYDDHSWDLISAALKSDQREKIHYLNRAKIVNDLFALYFADTISFSRLTDVFEFLENETEYAVWFAAVRGLNKMRSMFKGAEVINDIENYIIKLTSSAINKIGYEAKASEGTVEGRHRMQILDIACKAGHTGCIDFAKETFRKFKDEGVAVPPSLRPVTYCNGLKYGDEEDFDFLWNRMVSTNIANERTEIMNALGCSSSEIKLKEYLYSLQKEELILTQDLTVPVSSVLSNPKNVDLVLNELQNNYDDWVAIYGSSMDSVLTTVASLLHDDDFDAFEEWLSTCAKCSQDSVKAASSSLATARANANWVQKHTDEIAKTFRNSASVMGLSLNVVFLCLTALLLKM